MSGELKRRPSHLRLSKESKSNDSIDFGVQTHLSFCNPIFQGSIRTTPKREKEQDHIKVLAAVNEVESKVLTPTVAQDDDMCEMALE